MLTRVGQSRKERQMRLPHAHLRRKSTATAGLAVLLLACSAAAAASSYRAGSASESSRSLAASTTAARAVAAGPLHTCAVTIAGAVKCWGSNLYGELGDGTKDYRLTPVDVSGLSGGMTAVAASDGVSGAHTCALTSSGRVKCWGANGVGQLGDDRSCGSSCSTPVDVSGLASGVQAIAAGADHTCALTGAGGVKCWGDNRRGQLGEGRNCGSDWGHMFCPTPVDVSGLTGGVLGITAGLDHTCALTSAGGVKCWGSNTYGELGDGTTTDRSIPVDVSGLASGMRGIDAGWFHTCARTSAGGAVKCWGSNLYGELGDGQSCGSDCLTPVDASALSSSVRAVDAADVYTCALTSAGGVKCWGAGPGPAAAGMTPVDISGLANGVAAIAAGVYHSCALTSGGGVRCWGRNDYGQLGDGTQTDRLTPVKVVGFEAVPPNCVVPNVVGKTLSKAERKIVVAHCKVGKITKKASSLKKKGRVLAQSPKGGKKLANGAKVKLTVGKGPAKKK
jgi:alpha-tubulin suppressor-like RCC1 family protein